MWCAALCRRWPSSGTNEYHLREDGAFINGDEYLVISTCFARFFFCEELGDVRDMF